MNLKNLLSRLTINKLSKFNSRRIHSLSWNYREICTSRCISTRPYLANSRLSVYFIRNPKIPIVHSVFRRFIHSSQETGFNGAKSVESASVDSVDDDDDDDGVMNEFLSRFVWIMRTKLTEVYTDADKKEIDAMLRIIVGKVVSEMGEGRLEHFMDSAEASVSEDFSEDLWETVREVSSMVLEDMKKAKKKEKMKSFLQSEEVKEMTRFAGEIGIRGDMLRELRFKWAREKLEDSEFYESLERMRKDVMEPEVESQNHGPSGNNSEEKDDDEQVVSLPKRNGKIKYKIYGLDLLQPKWVEVAEQIHETGGSIWPQEPKPISGKCKIVTEKIVSLQADDNPLPLIAEWIELLQPTRVDWLALLHRLKEKNDQMYFKVSELLLDEESFETNLRDYSQLVDAYAKHDRLDDAERIIIKMNVKGIAPDLLTKTTMVHMYSKAGNVSLAKQAFESLRTQGFQPDLKVYNSMIMAHLKAGDPKSGELIVKDLESKNLKPSKDMYLALIGSFAREADSVGAARIANRMQLAGYQPGVESNTYLVEAHTRKDQLDQAREHFDEILKLGFKPDDTCIAQMIAGYARRNYLDKAVHLLLQLEKDGIEMGVATYAALINWFGRLQLVDEAEDLVEKFREKGGWGADVEVSVCEMYARGRDEKKALQALGVVEANKENLGGDEFERVIKALLEGGFREDAGRMYELMVARGFTASNEMLIPLQASLTFHRPPRSIK